MRIECTESVVVNNIIGRAAANHRKIGVHFLIRELYTVANLKESLCPNSDSMAS